MVVRDLFVGAQVYPYGVPAARPTQVEAGP